MSERPCRFRHCEVDEEITNLVILEVVARTNSQATTEYRVKYLCCGDIGILKHKRIRERIADESETCLKCNRKATLKNETEAQRISRQKRRLAAQIAETLKPGIMGWQPPPSAVERGKGR